MFLNIIEHALMMVYAFVKYIICNNISILSVKTAKNAKNIHIIREKIAFFIKIFREIKKMRC